MEKTFLEFINNFKSPLDIKDELFGAFSARMEIYLSKVREKDRGEIKDCEDVAKRLRDLGAPMESYKLMKEDADYYRIQGNERLYWCKSYLSGAFANLGYPTKNIEKEVAGFCNVLRKEKKFHQFLPLFLFNYAGILHLYRDKNKEANLLYNEALNEIDRMKPESFNEVTGKGYSWARKLIINNYVDSLMVTDRNNEEEELIRNLIKRAGEEGGETETEYTRSLSMLNRAELNAREGNNEKANQILNEIFSGIDSDVRRFLEPAFYRIRAIILLNQGMEDMALKHLIRSFEEAGYYGNTLSETLTMREGLDIVSKISKNHPHKEKYNFLKEKKFFDYLLKVLKVKDWFLGSEHSKNVSDTALAIAERLNVDERDAKVIEVAGLLHDIGKFFVPWYSLNKILPLDNLDWELLEAHPVEGGRILKKLGLEREAKIVEEHHERIDGSGYPRGLSSVDTLTEIVAISDVFNAAITPNRKYKIPKPPELVLKEIKGGEKGGFSEKIIRVLSDYIGEKY